MSRTRETLIYLVLLLLLAGVPLVMVLPQLRLVHTAAPGQHLAATDWAVWQPDSLGLRCLRILPYGSTTANTGNDYITPGDYLTGIDYQPVYNTRVLASLLEAAGPGAVLLYQLNRPGTTPGSWQRLQVFVQVGYSPPMLAAHQPALHRLHLVWALLLVVVGLAYTLLVWPFLRSHLRENWPLAGLAIALALAGLTTTLRHTLLNLDTRMQWAAADLALAWMQLLWLALGGWLGLIAAGAGAMLRAAAGLGLAALLAVALWLGWRWQLSGPAENLVLGLVHGGWLLAVLYTAYRLAPWRTDLRLRLAVAAVLLALPAVTVWLALLPQPAPAWVWLALQLLLPVPLVLAGRSAAQFGKAQLVVSRAIVFAGTAALLFLAYLLADSALNQLAAGAVLRGLVMAATLTSLLLAMRWLAAHNRWLDRYFVFQGSKKEEALQAFASQVSRYTQSPQLLHDLETHLATYLETDWCMATLRNQARPEEAASPTLLVLADAEQDALAAALPALPGTYWCRYPQLAGADLPPQLHQWLLERGAALVVPIIVSKKTEGLLVCGQKKKGGVYNLAEVETVLRLMEQTRLTLEVLRLIERETLLERQTVEANLTALRSQINPHFLFNTLNTISALIHDAPNDAEQAIDKLAFIFRYTLKSSSQHYVPLEGEMSLVRNYLDIEQLRFGKRLEVSITVPEACRQLEIPALMIQTVVENAIKHGTGKLLGKGRVRIVCSKTPDALKCVIEDNGPGIDIDRVNRSTGLTNTQKRLETIYQRRGLLTFENTGSGTRVTFMFPLEQP